MDPNPDRISQLLQRLELLSRQQELFAKEIYALRNELYQLKAAAAQEVTMPATPAAAIQPTGQSGFSIVPEKETAAAPATPATASRPVHQNIPEAGKPGAKSNLEKFIGENLINKIGIGITIIGVAIGAKYSIEHDLISPLTRIILGYLAGLGLLLFGIKLKQKYESYSAVLVSGAMAIMYFITYAAYSFYNLFPQLAAFTLMLVFTIFTVVAAINYNKQVIAQIGLVGAYAVPFLLSDGSGRVAILFSYMAIINIGILAIGIIKYWKSLYYSSFVLTWLIFGAWYFAEYRAAEHYTLALVFLSIFFFIFYAIFLGYKLVKKEKFELPDILLLLANAFIFYGIGYSLFQSNTTSAQLLGLFTLINAVIHFSVSAVIYRQKLADRNLFFLVAGLSLVFITIAIPVQLNGNWVTLLWAAEALLLFWIGRTKNVPVYEYLSYPLMLLAFVSLLQDWAMKNTFFNRGIVTFSTPFLNINFGAALLFIAAFAGIFWINTQKKFSGPRPTDLLTIVSYAIPAILLFVLYTSIRIEIASYWDQLYQQSVRTIAIKGQDFTEQLGNYDLKKYKSVWIINYSLAFMAILSFLNIARIKNRQLGFINLVLNTLTIVVFLLQGLYVLSELRDSYLGKNAGSYPSSGNALHIIVRYICFALLALLLLACYRYTRAGFMKARWAVGFNLLLHLSILWVASSELINWMELARFSQSYKLGLSILWGVYALLLIALGIWKGKKHLRVGAIVLFGVTLLKLFFYDIADLDTIAKTIVFVSLGVLLLIISFLYNKYKQIIGNENDQ